MNLGISLWLSIVVIAMSAGFAVGGAYQKSRFTHYAFKPLTMILIISLAWDRAADASVPFGYFILAGLCLGLAGDIALMLPGNWLRQGMAAFAAGHILYGLAFAWGTKEFSLPALAALVAWGGAVYLVLRPGLGRLRLPVTAYMAIAVLMAWLGVCRHLTFLETKSLFVLAGGLLFLFSDSVNGFKRFRKPFRAAELLILPPYFAAQLLFALSI
jgi:uncharacterized membrane protein YhhN